MRGWLIDPQERSVEQSTFRATGKLNNSEKFSLTVVAALDGARVRDMQAVAPALGSSTPFGVNLYKLEHSKGNESFVLFIGDR